MSYANNQFQLNLKNLELENKLMRVVIMTNALSELPVFQKEEGVGAKYLLLKISQELEAIAENF